MVATGRRSSAPGPLRSLQRHARCRVWASIRPDRQGRPGLCPSGMIPQCLDGPVTIGKTRGLAAPITGSHEILAERVRSVNSAPNGAGDCLRGGGANRRAWRDPRLGATGIARNISSLRRVLGAHRVSPSYAGVTTKNWSPSLTGRCPPKRMVRLWTGCIAGSFHWSNTTSPSPFCSR